MRLITNTQRIFLSAAFMTVFAIVGYGQGTIELQHFRSEVQGKTIAFDWALSEVNDIKAFGIERAGEDFQFQTIGTIMAGPKQGASTTYQFTDQSPLSGAAFYRLKIMNHRGDVYYCKVISQEAAPLVQTGR